VLSAPAAQDEVMLMGNWRGKYLDGGPPRGPGRYADDGRWWWDEDRRRWFRVTDQEEVLEIEAQDLGGTSLAASLLTTLSSQDGNGYFRFVARARSAQGAWLDDQRERLQELHQQLLTEGWRPAGHGAHWWSAIYRRPELDWETPPDAHERTQRSA
jgi:hypothetical protein